MKSLKFKKIDAFTGSGSSGNPAGFIWMDRSDTLTEAEMQRIGAELQGFVMESDSSTGKVRGIPYVIFHPPVKWHFVVMPPLPLCMI